MATAEPQSSRWLYGPWTDLLLGCGLLYLGISIVAAGFGSGFSASLPDTLAPLIILLVSMPHYGATLVRVYEHREARRRYVIFSVYLTAALVLLFFYGIFDAGFASLMATLYLTWSPWHYTGQNYGIGVMLLRRRGADPSPLEKRILYAAFFFSFLLIALVLHSPDSRAVDPGGIRYDQSSVRFRSIGIDAAWLEILVPLVAALQLVAAVAWGGLALRRSHARAIAPSAILLLTQMLWFSAPALARHYGLGAGSEILDWNSRPEFFVFIAGGHAAQYLWVTSYYARAGQSWHGQPRHFLKVAAAGCAVWTLPVVLLAPGSFGRVEYGAGLALLLSSAVNLHHFILDGAVWKLRSSRVAGILIRGEHDEASGEPTSGPLRTAVWSAAALGLICAVWVLVDKNVLLPRAVEARDLTGTIRILDRVAWAGVDEAGERDLVARRLATDGNFSEAARQFERSASLRPRPLAYERLIHIYEILDDGEGLRRSQEALAAIRAEEDDQRGPSPGQTSNRRIY